MQPQLKSLNAPLLGGKTALLAQLDRAGRTEEFALVVRKILQCRENLVPDLLQRLGSDQVPIAQRAALTLGYLRSAQAIVPLFRALTNPDLHWQATAALGHIASPEAIEYLVKALDSPSLQLRCATAKALGKVGLPALSPLLQCLKDRDDPVKFYAVHSLGQIGSPIAVNDLLPLLNHRLPRIRSEVVWALGQIRSPLAVPHLAQKLTDPDISVQSSAVQALKMFGSCALPALTAMLKHSSSHTRSTAVRTLAQLGQEEVVGAIAELLFTDPFPYVRCDACSALGEIASSLAIAYLAVAVKDSDRSVRTAALRALRKIKSAHAQAVMSQIDPQGTEQGTTILQKFPQINADDYCVMQTLTYD
jgi:HEAT repeat protein